MKNKPHCPSMHFWKLALSVVCLLVLALAACTNSQGLGMDHTITASPTKVINPYEILDGGFISGEPCGPPCFLGIVPDITTNEQAMEILQNQLDISDCDEWPGIEGGQNIMCNPFSIQFDVRNKVDQISYSPILPIILDDVLLKYGSPDAVKVLGWSQDNGGITTSVTLLMYFESISTVIGLPEQAGVNYSVTQSTQIGGINYLGVAKWGLRGEDIQPWLGYGEYEGSYWAGP